MKVIYPIHSTIAFQLDLFLCQKGLVQLEYPCTRVFVTFEKEDHQQIVLKKLSVPRRHARKNNKSVLEGENYVFEDTVLYAVEPSEPNAIRWQDLNADAGTKIKEYVFTFLLSCASIAACGYIVNAVDKKYPGLITAFVIAGKI